MGVKKLVYLYVLSLFLIAYAMSVVSIIVWVAVVAALEVFNRIGDPVIGVPVAFAAGGGIIASCIGAGYCIGKSGIP